jgi:IPT/TIG domain-containing protein
VIVKGTNFIGVTAVTFNSKDAANFFVKSETEIIAVSPPMGKNGNVAEVRVTTPAGRSQEKTPVDSFVYEPTVTKVEPSRGPEAGGTSVTITGSGFEGEFTGFESELIVENPVIAVEFGGRPAMSFRQISSTEIVAVSPPGTSEEANVVVSIDGIYPEVIRSAVNPSDVFSHPPPICGEREGVGFAALIERPLSGAIVDKRLNQRIALNEGSFGFNTAICLAEQGPLNGTISGGSLKFPAFAAPIKICKGRGRV